MKAIRNKLMNFIDQLFKPLCDHVTIMHFREIQKHVN